MVETTQAVELPWDPFKAFGVLARELGPRLHRMGYVLEASGPSGLRWAREQQPVWAIVLAVLLFPIGLLFLLVKRDSRVSLELVPTSSGSRAAFTELDGPPRARTEMFAILEQIAMR